MYVLKIIDLTKKYLGKRILDHINFRFESGSVYGIIGNNGAGKTTLFNCITKNIAYEGNILLNHKIKIGYLPDDLFFYPKTTGREYVEFFIAAKKAERNFKKIDELNKIFKLPLDSKYTKNYSAGMKKKLAFMAILLQENDIYVLDEPFNNLDIKSMIEFQKIVSLLANKNKTFIISSHIMEPLKKICDSVTIIDRGKIMKTFEKNDFNNTDAFFQQGISEIDCINELF